MTQSPKKSRKPHHAEPFNLDLPGPLETSIHKKSPRHWPAQGGFVPRAMGTGTSRTGRCTWNWPQEDTGRGLESAQAHASWRTQLQVLKRPHSEQAAPLSVNTASRGPFLEMPAGAASRSLEHVWGTTLPSANQAA